MFLFCGHKSNSKGSDRQYDNSSIDIKNPPGVDITAEEEISLSKYRKKIEVMK